MSWSYCSSSSPNPNGGGSATSFRSDEMLKRLNRLLLSVLGFFIV